MPLGNQTSAHEWKMPPESRHPTGQLTFLWVLTTGASHKRVKGKNSCLILNARAWYGRVRPPIRCACGEIGRRARLRIWCRKAYRFESCQAHQTNIIRTYFQSVMGSDLLFSLTAMKPPISATAWSASPLPSQEAHGKRRNPYKRKKRRGVTIFG